MRVFVEPETPAASSFKMGEGDDANPHLVFVCVFVCSPSACVTVKPCPVRSVFLCVWVCTRLHACHTQQMSGLWYVCVCVFHTQPHLWVSCHPLFVLILMQESLFVCLAVITGILVRLCVCVSVCVIKCWERNPAWEAQGSCRHIASQLQYSEKQPAEKQTVCLESSRLILSVNNSELSLPGGMGEGMWGEVEKEEEGTRE